MMHQESPVTDSYSSSLRPLSKRFSSRTTGQRKLRLQLGWRKTTDKNGACVLDLEYVISWNLTLINCKLTTCKEWCDIYWKQKRKLRLQSMRTEENVSWKIYARLERWKTQGSSSAAAEQTREMCSHIDM